MGGFVKKDIILKDGNKIILSISDGYCTNHVSICKGYIEKGKLIKSLELSIWDDVSFRGWVNSCDSDKLEFEFDINDPLYFCFNRLLDRNNSFVIDDDNTLERMKKYMVVSKENCVIKVAFINTLKHGGLISDTFSVFIKNIGPDPRSKISDFRTKLRIVGFFRDCEKILTDDCYQMTLDEQIEILRYNKMKESKDCKIKKLNLNSK